MAKPTKTPDHATAVTGDATRYVEPTTTKTQGWPDGAKPAAQNINWLFYIIYEWCVWLRDFELTAHTWEAKQTYNVSIDVSNSVVNGYGITTIGNGTGYGIRAIGGIGGGAAVRAEGRGGLAVSATSDTATAVNVTGGTNQTAMVVAATGNASAASFTGAGTGHGIIAAGGARGVSATGANNNPGVHSTGQGTGAGIVAMAGATGHGVDATASTGNAVNAVSSSTGAAVKAIKGTGLAVDAVGDISTDSNVNCQSTFTARSASGTSVPTPAITHTEHVSGGVPWFCKYTWTMGTIIFENGKGVYAIDKIADGDVWITWQYVPASLAEAQRKAGWAVSSNISVDHALITDRDNSGVGGRLRYRVQTLDNTDTLFQAATDVFCIPD